MLQKENTETVKIEIKRLLDSIRDLDDHCYQSEDHPGVSVKFKTLFTMIDSGAVNKATDNTDQHKCRICRKRMVEYR